MTKSEKKIDTPYLVGILFSKILANQWQDLYYSSLILLWLRILIKILYKKLIESTGLIGRSIQPVC